MACATYDTPFPTTMKTLSTHYAQIMCSMQVQLQPEPSNQMDAKHIMYLLLCVLHVPK